jgi:hypothetical protein
MDFVLFANRDMFPNNAVQKREKVPVSCGGVTFQHTVWRMEVIHTCNPSSYPGGRDQENLDLRTDRVQS